MTRRDAMCAAFEHEIDPRRRTVRLGLEVDGEGRIVSTRSTGPAKTASARDGRDRDAWTAHAVIGEYASDLFVGDDVLTARALVHRATHWRPTAPALLQFRGAEPNDTVVAVSAVATMGGAAVRIRDCDGRELTAFHEGSGARARLDPLTGLPNTPAMLDRTRHALATAPHALVLVDLDRFRDLLTAFGPRAADSARVEIGDRLVAAVGGAANIGFSGTHFIVLAPLATGRTGVGELIAKLHAVIGEPIIAPAGVIDLTACTGLALSPVPDPRSGRRAEEMFADAEVALAQAKAAGPGHDAVFDPAFRRRAVRKAALQTELSRAVDGNELRLDFQPIVQMQSADIVGYEALVRWQHPHRGLLAPRAFLGFAQRSSVGADIDDWVLREACRQAAEWTSIHTASTICVNVAPERFVTPGFVDRVVDVVEASGLEPSRLLLEITEWSVLADLDAARRTTNALGAFGARVALDDYGTGYASLANVATMPVDELKIDVSFTAGLGSDRARTAIVRAIVGLGNALDITVVAEGVESADQAFALQALGCEYGQGFHFGRPTPFPAPVSNVVAGIS